MLLVEASELGRDRTIGTLLDLSQRLLQAAPIQSLPTPHSQGRSKAVHRYSQRLESFHEPASTYVQQTTIVPNAKKHQQSQESKASHGTLAVDAKSRGKHTQSHASRLNRESFFDVFKHHASDHAPRDNQERGVSYLPFKFRQTPRTAPSALASGKQEPEQPQFSYQEGEDNPFEIWGSRPSQDTQHSSDVSVLGGLPGSTPSSSTMTVTRPWSSSPLTTQQNPTLATIPNPNPENGYLGFCSGAVQLQNGDRKAMRQRKEFKDGWSQSTVYFLACSGPKCAFAGHVNVELIWSKVFKMRENHGIKFRWPFLAKSHVCQPKFKDRHFEYKCVFCVFSGMQAPVIHGEDLYLDHVRQEHRGSRLSDVVLWKTGCVNDHICRDEEKFDINLFPLTGSEQATIWKRNGVLSNDLLVKMNGRSSNVEDSVFWSGPWSQG